MEWHGLNLTDLANSVILFLTTVIGFAAVYVGRRANDLKQKPSTAVSMQGAAIISSEPLNVLAGSIEALSAEMVERREADEKMRSLAHQQIELDRTVIDQMKELRSEMRRLGDVLLQHG